MAVIRKRGEKWGVSVRIKGHKAYNKTFSSEIDAIEWGGKIESMLRSSVDLPFPVSAYLTKQNIVRQSQSASPISGVYFLIRNGDITYIGASNHLRRRIIQHQNDGRKFDSYSFIECAPERMFALEKYYIEDFNPPGNYEHRGDVKRGSHKERLLF